jgi:hypothetical protein
MGPSWSWSYGSWIYNYLCNQCLSPLTLRVPNPFMGRCTRYNIMWESLSVTCGRSVVFSGYSGSSTNKNDSHDITEILLKVLLETISPPVDHSLSSPWLGTTLLELDIFMLKISDINTVWRQKYWHMYKKILI